MYFSIKPRTPVLLLLTQRSSLTFLPQNHNYKTATHSPPHTHSRHNAGPATQLEYLGGWAVTVKGSPMLAIESAQSISLLTFSKVSMEFRAGCARGRGVRCPDILASCFSLQTMERQQSPKFEEDRITACSCWESC